MNLLHKNPIKWIKWNKLFANDFPFVGKKNESYSRNLIVKPERKEIKRDTLLNERRSSIPMCGPLLQVYRWPHESHSIGYFVQLTLTGREKNARRWS